MRFLGVGDDCALADMYLRLAAAGHEVKVHVADPASATNLAEMIPHVDDWEAELGWVRAAAENGIVLFENAHMGAIQDDLRHRKFNVIGGCSFGDRLEQDRAFGQQRMRDAGLKTAGSHSFVGFESAIEFIRREPGRYVFKLNGNSFASSRNYVGEMEDGADVIALLRRHQALWRLDEPPSFVLMEHKDGVEVGVGGYFNGQAFMDAVVIDWEHKRFFNDDLGELTGEMGTLISYRNSKPLFDATLAKMAPQLAAAGYVGYININTIVNEHGIWPLEFTCRFGYPGYAICDALHDEGWDVMFARMIARDRLDFRTHSGFAVGVALTVPPFPYGDRYDQMSKGMPILFRGELADNEARHIHFIEVERQGGELLTSGEIGHLMVVTGRGSTVEAARDNTYRLVRRVVVPNLRYRTDIGMRFIRRDRALLQRYGLWPPDP